MPPPTRKSKRRRENAKPRHPHTISPSARREILNKLLDDPGMTLRDADIQILGMERMAHGASPPFLPGDIGSRRRARKKPKKGK